MRSGHTAETAAPPAEIWPSQDGAFRRGSVGRRLAGGGASFARGVSLEGPPSSVFGGVLGRRYGEASPGVMEGLSGMDTGKVGA